MKKTSSREPPKPVAAVAIPEPEEEDPENSERILEKLMDQDEVDPEVLHRRLWNENVALMNTVAFCAVACLHLCNRASRWTRAR